MRVSGKSLFLAQWWLRLQSFPRTRTSEPLTQQATLKVEKRTKSKLNPLLVLRWGPETEATLVEVECCYFFVCAIPAPSQTQIKLLFSLETNL